MDAEGWWEQGLTTNRHKTFRGDRNGLNPDGAKIWMHNSINVLKPLNGILSKVYKSYLNKTAKTMRGGPPIPVPSHQEHYLEAASINQVLEFYSRDIIYAYNITSISLSSLSFFFFYTNGCILYTCSVSYFFTLLILESFSY